MAKPLPATLIEHIHDILIGIFLPFDQPVDAAEFRDLGMIESSVNRPFHGAGDVEFYPTLPEKAASLFHSLACNHCFLNGNKRTAVMALDFFLFANSHLLILNSHQVYQMAIDTVEANSKGVPLQQVLDGLSSMIAESIVSMEGGAGQDFFSRLDDAHRKSLFNHIIRVTRFVIQIARIHMTEIVEQFEKLEAELLALAPDAVD